MHLASEDAKGQPYDDAHAALTKTPIDAAIDAATGARRQQLIDRMAQRANETTYWAGIYQGLQDAGKTSTLSRDTVKPGDEVKFRSKWYPVHRANLKTVSVKLLGEHVSFTNTIGYHEITGHRRPTDNPADPDVAP